MRLHIAPDVLVPPDLESTRVVPEVRGALLRQPVVPERAISHHSARLACVGARRPPLYEMLVAVAHRRVERVIGSPVLWSPVRANSPREWVRR